MFSKFSKGIAICAIAMTAQIMPVYATTLDTSFGTGGKASTDFFGGANFDYATIVDSQDRIVAAGYANNSGTINFALARFLTDGTLDSTFGTGGKVTLSNDAEPYGITGIVEQADGKYVAVGTFNVTGTNKTKGVLVRFNTDGSLDTSFGTGGIADVVATGNLFPFAVTLDAQQRIVFTGVNRNSIFVARYTTAGTPDATFSGDGFKRIKQASGDNSVARAIGIDSTGKIVIGGFVSTATGSDWVVLRLRKNGPLDTTFNGTGQLLLGSQTSIAYALAIASDDSVYLAGNVAVGGPPKTGLTHVLSNGTLDTSFGTSGFAIVDPQPGLFGASTTFGIQLDADENVVAMANFAYDGTGGQFVAMRFTPAGVLDSTFGTSGLEFVKFGTSSNTTSSVAIQPDGKIVGGGSYLNGTNFVFAVFRLIP